MARQDLILAEAGQLYDHRIREHIVHAVQADFADAYVRIEAAPNMIYCAALLADRAGPAAAERRWTYA